MLYQTSRLTICLPRGGDFLYDDLEFESMIEDVKFSKQAGAHGVVLGILTKDGQVDVERNKRYEEEW
jgi:copper homeostasis protein